MRLTRQWRIGKFMSGRLALLGLAVALVTAAGCGGGGSSGGGASTGGGKGDGEYTLGVDYLGLQFPYEVALQNAVEDQASKEGIKLIQLDAKTDPSTELANMESLIAKKPDAILFNGLDVKASGASLKLAEAAGIPVVTFSTVIRGPQKAWSGSYNHQSGAESGKWLLKQADKANGKKLKVLYLQGIPGHPAFVARKAGMLKEIGDRQDEFAFTPKVADFDRAKGLRATEEALAAGEFDAIVAQNDEMALGALQVLEERGLTSKIKLLGGDGDPEALKAVADGKMAGTILQDAEQQGTWAVKLAKKYLDTGKVESVHETPFVLIDTPEGAADILPAVKALYGDN